MSRLARREADLGRSSARSERERRPASTTRARGSFNISRPLCSEIVRGHIWNPDAKLTTGDEMRDRIIGALDTGCRRGEMMKIQNKHVDWRHRWIRILKEHSKTEVARVIPFERGSRLEKLLRRRAFLGPDAYVFGRRHNRRVRGELSFGVGNAVAGGQRHRADASGQRASACRIERRSRISTCTGTTYGTRRCLGSQTMAFRCTSCRCSRVTRTSRRRSAT